MPKTDAIHDYRPDPTFHITSHLSTAPAAEPDARIPASAKKAAGLLDGFNEWFLYGHGADIQEPSGLTLPVGKAWSAYTQKERYDYVMGRSWAEICTVLKGILTADRYEAGGLTVHSKEQDKEYKFRPYFARLLKLEPTWVGIKRKFLEEAGSDGNVIDKPQGLKIMVGMLKFRRGYDHALILALKQGGYGAHKDPSKALRFNAKAVGSADVTSDIDITIGGPDEVAAVTEAYRYHREWWGREMLSLHDTMLYVRDWMTVVDTINEANEKEATVSDPSIQVQVLDFIGDIYGLAKIRRYTFQEQWDAFVAAVKEGVTVPGLENASAVPMFGRLDLVDQVFQTQYVEPMYTRCAPLKTRWEAEQGGRLAGDYKRIFPECETEKAQMLEALTHYDRDAVLRQVHLAYMELAGKRHDDFQKILTQFPGNFRWLQNKGAALVPKDVPLSLAGMAAFTDRQSQLVSEMALFASEAYFAQGTLWDIVGGQGGAVPGNINTMHYLQSFNEQIGDAMKELHEYWHEAYAALKHGGEHAGDHFWNDIFTGYYRASKYEHRMYEIVKKLDQLFRKDPVVKARIAAHKKLFPGEITPDEQDIASLGFEAAVSEFYDRHVNHLLAIRKLGKITDSTASSAVGIRRLGNVVPLAPGDATFNADAARRRQADTAPKREEDYSRATAEECRAEAAKFVEAAVREGSEFNVLVRDPSREHGLLKWRSGSQWEPMAPLGDDGKPDGKLGWGMQHLMHHLLSHAAIVNKAVRNLLSRGPVDHQVRTFAP